MEHLLDCIAYILSGTVIEHTDKDILVAVSLHTANKARLAAQVETMLGGKNFLIMLDEPMYEWVVFIPTSIAHKFEVNDLPFSGYSAYMGETLHEGHTLPFLLF